MEKHTLNIARAFIPAIAICALLSACAGPEYPGPPGTVLFQDDFSRRSSGWDRYQDDMFSTDYVEGGFRIHITSANADAWANPHISVGDIRLKVEATKVGGPDDNLFGVLCRYQDAGNFYFLVVSSDGYTGIGISKLGRRTLVSGDTMLPSAAVLQGDQTNHLRAECVGFDLRLYVNGVLVAEGQAAEWPDGDVGLIAGTYEQAGTEIVFDNFSVVKP
ncbi:MAG: hypothetical protein PVF70_08700 [Anaerolineales bacterium]|jgi:hypothetical protein